MVERFLAQFSVIGERPQGAPFENRRPISAILHYFRRTSQSRLHAKMQKRNGAKDFFRCGALGDLCVKSVLQTSMTATSVVEFLALTSPPRSAAPS